MSMSKTSPRKYAGYRNAELRERVLRLVDRSGHTGMTVHEIAAHFDPDTEAHHGDISGTLSMLHRDLVLARLTEKREGCKVYVHRDFLDSRPCEAQGRGVNRLDQDEIDRLCEIRDLLDYWFTVDNDGARFTTDKTRAERYPKQFFARARRLVGDSVNP